MAQLKPTSAGVHVFTDQGIFIGTAKSNGQALTSTAALAQLGMVEDEDGLRYLTQEERLAALGIAPAAIAEPSPQDVATPAVASKPAARKPVAKKPVAKKGAA